MGHSAWADGTKFRPTQLSQASLAALRQVRQAPAAAALATTVSVRRS